jgi:ankyrin repeat protein
MNVAELPLHSSQHYYATVYVLLVHGADVNAQRCNYETPLHLASLRGSLELSNLLIGHGADIDAQDDEGRTPFSIALANEHHRLARFLLNDRVPEHDRRARVVR